MHDFSLQGTALTQELYVTPQLNYEPVSAEMRKYRQIPNTWANLCAKGRRVIAKEQFDNIIGGMEAVSGKKAAVAVLAHLGAVLETQEKFLDFLPNIEHPDSKEVHPKSG